MSSSQEFEISVKKSKEILIMNFMESTTGRNLEAYKGFISICPQNGLFSLLRQTASYLVLFLRKKRCNNKGAREFTEVQKKVIPQLHKMFILIDKQEQKAFNLLNYL